MLSQFKSVRFLCFMGLFVFLFFWGMNTQVRAACDYLSDDFSTANEWSEIKNAFGGIGDGVLIIKRVQDGKIGFVQREIDVEGFFAIDVSLNVQGENSFDAAGIYVFADGMSFEAGSSTKYNTDGVNVLYHPATGEVEFYLFDVDDGEWVRPVPNMLAPTSDIQSIGVKILKDKAIFRLNGRDTTFVLPGDFELADSTMDTIWLMAQGTDTFAQFDNLCISAADDSAGTGGMPYAGAGEDDEMPAPSRVAVFSFSPVAAAVISAAPEGAAPLGFGPVAAGGDKLALFAGLAPLDEPVDIYVGVQSDALGGALFLFGPDNMLHPFSGELMAWRQGSNGGFENETILPEFPVSLLPRGLYKFYFLVSPANDLDVFYLWSCSMELGSDSLAPVNPGEDNGGGGNNEGSLSMREEISQNLDLILETISGMFGGQDELKAIFADKNVVKVTPEEMSFQDLQAGKPIFIDVDFGAGYTLPSGVVMTGSAKATISNVRLEANGMGAELDAVINDIRKDGAPLANGHVSGKVDLNKNDQGKYDISGFVDVDNLTLSGVPQSGHIDLGGTMEKINIFNFAESVGTIILNFSNFTSGNYQLNSGNVAITMGQEQGRMDVSSDLQTSYGPMQLDLVINTEESGATRINTTSQGTAGPYKVTIQDVLLDKNVCAKYPASGVITMIKGGVTGIVTFTGACDGSFDYQER